MMPERMGREKREGRRTGKRAHALLVLSIRISEYSSCKSRVNMDFATFFLDYKSTSRPFLRNALECRVLRFF